MDYNSNSVGIIGYWFATNYGGVASYFSLYSKIEKMGFSPLLIENPYYFTDKEGEDVFSRNLFKSINANICEPFEMDELDNLNKMADCFILGSDQVFTSSSISAFGKLFLMEFAKDEKRKIAVSASCGGDNLKGRPEIVEYAKRQLSRFTKVSVREYKGLDIVRHDLNINAEFMIDPIFFTNAETYIKMGESIEKKSDKPYLLAYILDPTDNKREGILSLADKLGLDIKIALDGRKFTHEKNFKAMNLPEFTLPELDFYEWIHYYSHASYIITDSFHGAAMSLILNKPFIAYANYGRGYPRFLTLFRLFNLKNRLIENSEQITYSLLNDEIDFIYVNSVIADKVKEAEEYIRDGILSEENESKSVVLPSKCVNVLLEKEKCVGCGACVNICPTNAICFEEDEWGYYRATVKGEKCVNCGKCSSICPAISLPEKQEGKPECYEFIANDNNILWNSSSGGFFSTIARKILMNGGVVVGAAWKNDLTVEHILIDDESDLYKLQKSKYLQSYIGTVFRQVKERLEKGQEVLFTGCPCQIAGLKAYLQKTYNNLLTIDLLCGNSPSAGFFKKYIEDVFPKGISRYEFRNKKRGYNAECVEVEDMEGNVNILFSLREDAYQRVYHNHTMCPPHCENCKYQSVPRYGDLTIGDFWGLSKYDKETDFSKGVSVVLTNSEKGKEYIEEILNDNTALVKKVPLYWLGGNGYALEGHHNYASRNRDKFYDAIQKMSFSNAVSYALKSNKGIYHSTYESVNIPLMLNSSLAMFSFDQNVWEEHIINGKITMLVKPNQWNVGKYANLPLARPLKKGTEYLLEVKFKIRTQYELITFHVRDSGTGCIQVITSYRIPNNNDGNKWYTVRKKFIPDMEMYDQFMIGASQISGYGNYIAFDYINIKELNSGE